MPALRQEEMVSTERDLGPSVPTIFVIAGKKFYMFFVFFPHTHTHTIKIQKSATKRTIHGG
jgi:hypothetical protein